MFTQCPDCKKLYPVTKKQSRAKKTKFYCSNCKKKFNAPVSSSAVQARFNTGLEIEDLSVRRAGQEPSAELKQEQNSDFQLTDASRFLKNRLPSVEDAESQHQADEIGLLPWEAEKPPLTINWLLGFMAGLILLTAQLLYFESSAWIQHPACRIYLEKICQWFGCRLAEYRNLAEIAVLQSSLSATDDGSFLFKAVLNNQGVFRQLLPDIKISLLDYNDQVFAQRIFNPAIYWPGAKSLQNPVIAADETVEISLTFAKIETKIGGYRFELVEK